ncbi:MAG: 4Fe-4S dicluster domain-containing protein [Thermodesulfobacteriota bacterium]
MKEVFVRADRCLGCLSCRLACAVEHSASKSLFGAITESPTPRSRLFVEKADSLNIPLTCRHCDPAPCEEACVAGSITRDSRGAVVQNENRCIGCWTCMMVCPYGVVTRQQDRKVAVKCDRCQDREVPACVGACPTKALLFAEPDEFEASVRKHRAGVLMHALAE